MIFPSSRENSEKKYSHGVKIEKGSISFVMIKIHNGVKWQQLQYSCTYIIVHKMTA